MSVLWDILLMAIERVFGSPKDSSRGKTGDQSDEQRVERVIPPQDLKLEPTRQVKISRKEQLSPNHLDFSRESSEIKNHRPLMSKLLAAVSDR